MTGPAPGLVRVYARVGIDGHNAGVWLDVAEAKAQDLVDLSFVTLTDNAGNGPPDQLRGLRCC